MQAPTEKPSSEAHFVKMQDDSVAAPVPASATASPQRPQLPPRANSDRGARPTNPLGSFRAAGSMRALVRMATMQEEPTSATATTTTAARPTARAARNSSVASRMQSMRLGQQPSVVPFVRAMSSMLRFNATAETPAEETFRCHICFDDVGVSEAVALASCGHKYCLSCVKPYLELKISEGNVYPVCFHPIENAAGGDDTTCGVAITQDQIQQIVTSEIYTKYEYFRFNKEHQHARECPYCTHSQDCAGPENPVCVCVKCEKSFCFFHGNAHEDGTCADYELKNAHEESLNRAKIDEISKPCPGCHRDVEKNGGCNHMKCIGCNTNFCWLCGEIVEDTPLPSHYAAESGGTCSGMQFDGMEQEQPTLSPWQWFVAIIIAIAAFSPALVLAIVISPLAWLCNRSQDFWELAGTVFGGSYVLICGLLGLAYTPIGWVIDLCWAIIVLLLLVIYWIGKGCFGCFCGCCRSRPATSADTDADVANDLEAGLVDSNATNGESGAAGPSEPRSYAV